MIKSNFESFVTKTLEVVQDYSKNKGSYITCGFPFLKPVIYNKGITPLSEDLLYFIYASSASSYIKFINRIENYLIITTNSGSNSITLNEDLEVRDSTNFSNIIKPIEHFQGTFNEKLTYILNAVMK
jgi:hypothetical protein